MRTRPGVLVATRSAGPAPRRSKDVTVDPDQPRLGPPAVDEVEPDGPIDSRQQQLVSSVVQVRQERGRGPGGGRGRAVEAAYLGSSRQAPAPPAGRGNPPVRLPGSAGPGSRDVIPDA